MSRDPAACKRCEALAAAAHDCFKANVTCTPDGKTDVGSLLTASSKFGMAQRAYERCEMSM